MTTISDPIAPGCPLGVLRTRAAGVVLAGATACVSGVAVFVNGYGVRRVPDPTTYTTAKNLVAALALAVVLIVATTGRSTAGLALPRTNRRWWGLLAVGVLGGSVPFVLSSRASPAPRRPTPRSCRRSS
jgi:hypothetical protein